MDKSSKQRSIDRVESTLASTVTRNGEQVHTRAGNNKEVPLREQKLKSENIKSSTITVSSSKIKVHAVDGKEGDRKKILPRVCN